MLSLLSRRKKRVAGPRRPRRTSLGVEQLGERVVPAAFTWVGGTSSDWFDPDNWGYVPSEDADGKPDPDDDVVIAPGENHDPKLTADATVKSLRTHPDWFASNTLDMDGYDLTVKGAGQSSWWALGELRFGDGTWQSNLVIEAGTFTLFCGLFTVTTNHSFGRVEVNAGATFKVGTGGNDYSALALVDTDVWVSGTMKVEGFKSAKYLYLDEGAVITVKEGGLLDLSATVGLNDPSTNKIAGNVAAGCKVVIEAGGTAKRDVVDAAAYRIEVPVYNQGGILHLGYSDDLVIDAGAGTDYTHLDGYFSSLLKLEDGSELTADVEMLDGELRVIQDVDGETDADIVGNLWAEDSLFVLGLNTDEDWVTLNISGDFELAGNNVVYFSVHGDGGSTSDCDRISVGGDLTFSGLGNTIDVEVVNNAPQDDDHFDVMTWGGNLSGVFGVEDYESPFTEDYDTTNKRLRLTGALTPPGG